jgi:hypothetical protein
MFGELWLLLVASLAKVYKHLDNLLSQVEVVVLEFDPGGFSVVMGNATVGLMNDLEAHELVDNYEHPDLPISVLLDSEKLGFIEIVALDNKVLADTVPLRELTTELLHSVCIIHVGVSRLLVMVE